jgi:LacI family transcriptional regulator
MPLTLEDIAHLSGFSRSTVSRVVNSDPNVREATRHKVMEIIQENDFHPNLAARRLAAGHTRIIGLVIPVGVGTVFSDPYFPQLIQGVFSACNVQEYTVMLWIADPEDKRRMAGQIPHSGLVDGVIVSSMLIDDPIVNVLRESRMPFILVGHHPTLDVNYIDMDNIQGGYQATLHLLHLGRKRVATISGPQYMIPAVDRYQGYLSALKEFHMPLESGLVAEADFTEMGGYAAMRKLLPENPDAVFVASDVMAQGVLRALRDVMLDIPNDVAIVGYDDIPSAAQSVPPLTTISQPIYQFGSLAVESLIDIIHHPEKGTRRTMLTPKLIIRESCGAAR